MLLVTKWYVNLTLLDSIMSERLMRAQTACWIAFIYSKNVAVHVVKYTTVVTCQKIHGFAKITSFVQMIREAFKQEKRIQIKSGMADLVTETDKKVEQLIISAVKEQFPTHW